MKQNTNECLMYLVGNQVDNEHQREVSNEEAEEYLKDHSLTHYGETSAKTGQNVEDIFKAILSPTTRHSLLLKKGFEVIKKLFIVYNDQQGTIKKRGDYTFYTLVNPKNLHGYSGLL